MRRDVRYPPSDDEVIQDDESLSEDQELDINAPTPEEERAFAFYYPNVQFFDMSAAIKHQIKKELGL